MEEEHLSQDLVPDSLLAFAKDHRYIRQCQDLLQSVLGRQDDNSTDLWWASALLYATLVVGRRGRTLGMEFVGLQHREWSPLQRRLGMMALAIAWGTWMRTQQGWKEASRQERHEALRGDARRYFHQQQRRAMLNRATRNATAESSSQPLNSNQGANMEGQTSSRGTLIERVQQAVVSSMKTMSEAIPASSSDSPHAMPAAAMSMGRWILRLHLAHFLLTGRYPTWLHRFWNLTLQRQEPSRISDPPPTTHRLVGKLILLQAGASLTQALARWFASYIAARKARTTPEERLEPGEAVPPAAAAAAAASSQHCGICRMPRSHSAVPSACGHVFCWKCLYQWVSTVRPECPLCRSPCRPQDIVALYHYAPS